MAYEFRPAQTEQVRTILVEVASATVIPPASFVALSSGLAVKAGAADTKIAWTPQGSKDGETSMEISVGKDFELSGTPDEAFAKTTHRGAEVDIVDDAGFLKIDLGTSTTKVLVISPEEKANRDGATDDIRFRINKPIY